MDAAFYAVHQSLRVVHGPTVGRSVRGFVHDSRNRLRRGMHHGQLYPAAGLLHDYDFDHTQLWHVPNLFSGLADASLWRGVRGRDAVGRCSDIHRAAHT